MKQLRTSFCLIALTAMVLAGCEKPTQTSDNSQPEPSATLPDPIAPKFVNTGLDNPEELPVGPEVGQLCPDIHGADLDGTKFKLSDYRGQVVMLDFYGDW